LVRRLLENGANTSFVHKIYNPAMPIDVLIADPVAEARSYVTVPHPKIPLPLNLLRPQRQNSEGIDLHNLEEIDLLNKKMDAVKLTMPTGSPWYSTPLISGNSIRQGNFAQAVNPANNEQVIGQVWNATAKDAEKAMTLAEGAFEEWSATPVGVRALVLDNLAALLEEHREEFMTLLVYEGGKTLPDAISEVREAADFCRYYAAEARRLMSAPLPLPGPTGEKNQLSLHGRGVFVCISPWNFPLAIFTGQIAAALAAGNCVLAKPSHQTPLVAYRVIFIVARNDDKSTPKQCKG
jgi:RHH-type proline utilization regulon transcriptional repressor/proline dehydrogenase/delta 1-pyrroline-5-carboxylate dehydrogenase